jgi:multidrug efflux system outer membrane protein
MAERGPFPPARRAGWPLALGAVVAVTAGCAIGPDFTRPEVPVGSAWQQAPVATTVTIADLPWWEVFTDPVLGDLIRAALAANRDVAIAAARVEEAAAVLGFVRADQFPALRYEAGATRAETSERVAGLPGALGTEYRAAATLAWEIDLWGRLRRSTEAARAELLATEAARRGVTISLVASVAQQYFTLRDLDNRLAIAERTLAGRRASTQLIATRFAGGVVSQLDLHQAEIEEATAAAAVPAFQREIVRVETALGVLLGRPPGPIPRGALLDPGNLPAGVPAGLPADLLLRRPDLVEAEARAHAQLARVGVAQALRLPTLRLTAAGGLASADLDDFTASGADFWSIGGGLTGPIFEFGRNVRRVEAERARTEQAVLRYEGAVLNALAEVESSLAGVATFADEYAARRGQVDSARAAARLSRARYDGGVTSYLEVLDIERSLFTAELAASQALQGRYTALVQLYRALGGGYPPEDPSPPAPSGR